MAEIGPVEYMAVAFPGNNFRGDIAPALRELVDSGTIRVIDMAFVGKSGDGRVLTMEAEELNSDAGRALKAIESKVGDLINEKDLEDIGAALEPNSSAAILLWEDLWAAKFTNAVRAAGGVLLDSQRVPHELMQTALEWAQEPAPVP
jgi:hypothetical protein